MNSPGKFHWRSARLRWTLYASALVVIAMGFYVREPFRNARLDQQVRALQAGTTAERETALQELVLAHAEDALTECLAHDDAKTAQLATMGLWECWLNERGADARRQIESGMLAMNTRDFTTAGEIFRELVDQYPDWAEALNKQATLFYLIQQPAESLALCRRVVALKPNHFGAWSGMALCAIQLEDWPLARQAARQAVRLQPHSESNRQILRAIDKQIPKLDV